MMYDVTVFLGDDVYSIETVFGMVAAEAIQDHYRQWPEYSVDIEPNVKAYAQRVGLNYPRAIPS